MPSLQQFPASTSKTQENTIHSFLNESQVDPAVTNVFDPNHIHIKFKLIFHLDKFLQNEENYSSYPSRRVQKPVPEENTGSEVIHVYFV